MFRVNQCATFLSIGMLVAVCISTAIAQDESSFHNDQGFPPRWQPLEPRPFYSESEPHDLTTRSEEDQQSVASFLKSLQGQDAMIEVVVGRSRLLTLEKPLAQPEEGSDVPVIAVGDPSVLGMDLLPNPQMIRLLGKRVGVTDLSLITAEGKALGFQIHVVYDLALLKAQLRQSFPDSALEITQIHDHIIVSGQAKSTQQSAQIIQSIQGFLSSVQVFGTTTADSARRSIDPTIEEDGTNEDTNRLPTGGDSFSASAGFAPAQVINLIRIPGVQQVMLQVRIAELNRTALREIGADIFVQDGGGNTAGTQIGGANTSLLGLALSNTTTAFGIFPSGSVEVFLRLLKNRQVVNILAEPNLVAMHGEEASFLAGGEFPVPIPQSFGGGAGAITIQFKRFGVQLNFTPYIVDDGVIRLRVAPEVSTIDNTIGVTTAGTSIPGINTRRVNTTVELRQGQTLALAGLLQVELEASNGRIPGLGDLPVIGSFFSNTSHQRVEKELIVLVTPVFVDGVNGCDVAPVPGSEITDPTDREFYLFNNIEGQPAPQNVNRFSGFQQRIQYERNNVYGPYGFSR